MKGVAYRDKKDLVVLEINDITEEKLISTFTKNVNGTVYITENNKLEGIVTIGDYNRNNKIINSNLINKKFTCIEENIEELKIEEIFLKKTKVNAIPIINKNKMIIGEYYRKAKREQSVDDNIIKNLKEIYMELYAEIIVGGYDCLYVRVGNVLKENSGIINEISLHTNNKIILCKEIEFENLTEISKNKKIFIIDIGDFDDGIKTRKVLYEQRNIDYMIYTKDTNKIKEAIKHISRVYKNIAVLQYKEDKNYIKDIINNAATTNVVLLDITKTKNSDDDIIYTELNDELKDTEVIFTLTTAIGKPYIVYQERIIPCVCIFEKVDITIKSWTDWDIAVNIIPKLRQNNIETIIINNPELESDEVKSFSNDENGPLSQAYECEKFWKDDYEYIDQIKTYECYTNKKGYIEVENCETTMVNYCNGVRHTIGNPKEYENTIYLYGPCFVRGIMVTDRYTLASFLRNKIDKKYYLENRGNVDNIKNISMRLPTYKRGDIVIIMVWDSTPYKKLGIKLDSIASVFSKIPNLKDNMWDSVWHVNSYVTGYVADEILSILEKNIGVARKNSIINEGFYKFSSKRKNEIDDIPQELKKWIEEIKRYKMEGNRRTGSIVMNCNPFTLGHRYLIEKAKAQVDYLYIFVVEEDKSFFEFNDRFEMVKRGVEDLENIAVLSSGRYIISSETLPGYFDKDNLQSVELNASKDIDIFGNIIAKCLNINVRFAGEEPIDAFTRQYNETMKRMLPERGIEFVEIPRVCKEEQVISASRVRKLLKEKKYEEISNLVPNTTYDYMKMKYFE